MKNVQRNYKKKKQDSKTVSAGVAKRKIKTPGKKAVRSIAAKRATATKANFRKSKGSKKGQVKASVTVKKLSKELQLIKGFVAMNGKTYKAGFIEWRHTQLFNSLPELTDHKATIENIWNRVGKIVSAIKRDELTTVTINIEKSFLKKCTDIIGNAKVRIRTEFLSGTKSEIISTKTAAEICADWHSGQWSALHSFASTKKYIDSQYKDYLSEIDENNPTDSKQKHRLQQLKRYFEYKRNEIKDKDTLNGVTAGLARFTPKNGKKVVVKTFNEWADILPTVEGNVALLSHKIERIELSTGASINIDYSKEKPVDVFSIDDLLNIYVYDGKSILLEKALKVSATRKDKTLKNLIKKHTGKLRHISIVLNNYHKGLNGVKKQKRLRK